MYLSILFRSTHAASPCSQDVYKRQGIAYPTAALLRSLLWVSDGYVSPRDTALIDVDVYKRQKLNGSMEVIVK